MKYLKLFEGFLSEKEKKEDEEKDPGTVLSNTTGIIASAEVAESSVGVYAITCNSTQKLGKHEFKSMEDFNSWAKESAPKNEIYGPYLDKKEFEEEYDSGKPQKVEHKF
jgi:hypothetical protein